MSALVRTIIAALAALGAFAAPACAEIVASDDGARVERLAENVYAIIHDDATDEWPHGNTGVVVGRRGVFVFDSTYLPSRARADIALIRQVTDKPVRYLATSHWHFDHNNGAIAYREAFPDVELIAETNTARWVELNQIYWSRMSTAADSVRRAAVSALEAELARGAEESGAPYSEAERRSRAAVIAQRRNELAELEGLTVVAPNRVFGGELRLNFEGMPIRLRDWGPANSPHDVTLYLPRQRILFSGDILVQAPFPFPFSAWPVSWARVLEQLEAMPVDALVPGHGPVMADHTYTRQVRMLMETAITRVDAMAREGKTLQQIQDTLLLEDVRTVVPAWNGPDATDADWDSVRRTLIERVWRGIRGQD